MATYLELCADYHLEAGISGSAPSAVTNQQGDNKRIVHWIKKAWQDLQLRRSDWLFLRQDFTLPIVADQREYGKSDLVTAGATNADRFRSFDINNLSLYTSAGVASEDFLTFIPYELFRDELIGTQIETFPDSFSINDAGNLVLDTIPHENMTLRGTFIKSPQVLAANTDVPDMPEYFHDMITYMALIRYGYFEASIETINSAKERLAYLNNQLLIEQLPKVIIDGGI